MLQCVVYWTVLAGKSTQHVHEEPIERSDGTLILPSGEALLPNTFRVIRHEGDPPKMPRASIDDKAGRPRRIKPADGYGEHNTL